MGPVCESHPVRPHFATRKLQVAICDSAYALRPWIMTPFLTPRTESERQYNSAHKRTRNLIERTFGLLKARFRCLHRSGGALQYTPITAFKIVVACAILHNIATRRGLPLTPADPDPDDEEQEQPHRHHGDRSLANQGRLRRDHIATQYFGRYVTPTAQEGPYMSTPPTEEAHSDDSSSVQLDLDDHPGPSGTSGQSVPITQSQATTELPPSGNTSTALTQRAHTSVPRTRQSAVCPPLQGTQANPPPHQQQGPGGRVSGHTVQGTEAQEHRGTERAAVRQGEDRPREPILHEALSNFMGAYHHSQETMAAVLAKFQETQGLQEEQYLGFREELRAINSPLGTIVGVLK
ncbi:hypothetical protein NDU88_003482 [Pleurodeles waltl]|uniref:DDE Tnp4 domain-containing protein n=1 Tax=Pleurodeles waltl TaxID=8319 RepID=A0AAV7MSC4_PLEWA|nr:hypothetical protein NDU88_003482 [Pleurodeles waltl]